jgi:SAM-dependent methyltransferase
MIFVLFFLSLSLLVFVLFIFLNILYTVFLKVPMLSTDKEVVENIVKNIDFSQAEKFYDLGSGNGKVSLEIARRFPDLECIGIELNIAAFCFSKIKNIFSKCKVDYRFGNFFKANISDADVVFIYLFPGFMERIERKFKEELKCGAIVITNTFPLKNKKPEKIIENEKNLLGKLYIYEYKNQIDQ